MVRRDAIGVSGRYLSTTANVKVGDRYLRQIVTAAPGLIGIFAVAVGEESPSKQPTGNHGEASPGTDDRNNDVKIHWLSLHLLHSDIGPSVSGRLLL